MKAVLETYPELEFFPGSELHLLDGLRKGAAGVISATANVSPGPMRALFDSWEKPGRRRAAGEDLRAAQAVQAYPVIPLLKALVAHYRERRAVGRAAPAVRDARRGDRQEGDRRAGREARPQARVRRGGLIASPHPGPTASGVVADRRLAPDRGPSPLDVAADEDLPRDPADCSDAPSEIAARTQPRRSACATSNCPAARPSMRATACARRRIRWRA